jgi:hypothetical protein
MFSFFKTVDSVLADFQSAVDDLKALEETHGAKAAQYAALSDAHIKESDRAAKVASKITDLIS